MSFGRIQLNFRKQLSAQRWKPSFSSCCVTLQVNVKAKSAFNNKLFALNVVISIPVPDNTAKADVQTTQGKAKYDAKKHALVWKIKRFTGQTESALVASVELIATTREKKAWARPPISMSFQVCTSQAACSAKTRTRRHRKAIVTRAYSKVAMQGQLAHMQSHVWSLMLSQCILCCNAAFGHSCLLFCGVQPCLPCTARQGYYICIGHAQGLVA